MRLFLTALIVIASVVWSTGRSQVAAQESDAQATIEALQTQVAELSGTGTPTPTAVSQRSEMPSTTPAASGQVNVEIILDVSGSMAQVVDTGESRMEAAKRVLNEVLAAVPDREGVNVGLRIYGHQGDNTEAGAAVSCQSSDLVAPVEGVNRVALAQVIAPLQPTGWTPIALSLDRAAQDFPVRNDDVTNAVILVTDGLETCGGDPASSAAALQQGESNITTHVIGFALTGEEQQLLASIAEAGQGQLLGASNAAELSSALFTVLEELEIVAGTGFVGGNAFSLVPAGETGEVSVVATGTLERMTGGTVPFVVRNNTPEDIAQVKVVGTIRGADGRVAGAANGLIMTPTVVNPGGLTFGQVYFGDIDIPGGATVEFAADASPASDLRSRFFRDLDVTEASIFENRIVGTLQNIYEEPVKGTIVIQAVCFDLDGTLLSLASGYSDIGTVDPEEELPFQVTLFYGSAGPACPAFLVAGYGYEQ